jgi:hypothetical protein
MKTASFCERSRGFAQDKVPLQDSKSHIWEHILSFVEAVLELFIAHLVYTFLDLALLIA